MLLRCETVLCETVLCESNARSHVVCALSGDQRKKVKQVIHSGVYSCGCGLFPTDSSLCDTVICRQALSCKDPMEAQYYISVCVAFPPVCWFYMRPQKKR